MRNHLKHFASATLIAAASLMLGGCSFLSNTRSANTVGIRSYSPDGEGRMKLVESKDISGIWSDGRAKYVETTIWELSPDGSASAKVFQHVEVDRYDDTSGAVQVATTKAQVAGEVTTHATDAVATVGVSAIAAQVGGASTFQFVPQIISAYNRLKEASDNAEIVPDIEDETEQPGDAGEAEAEAEPADQPDGEAENEAPGEDLSLGDDGAIVATEETAVTP